MSALHRRNLPHLYFEEGKYFITYRLAGSIPISKLFEQKYTATKNNSKQFIRLFRKYDKLMDSKQHGINCLENPEVADICKASLHYPNGKDYRLICYTIMPNHVHLVFELLPGNKGISKIMQSIKRVSARKSNVFLGRTGKFWQDESFDRWIRDETELYNIIKYVLLNPVEAGLVRRWDEYKNTYCHKDFIVL